MAQINPYINFEGNCREAMNFYKECLDGELMMQTVEGSPAEAHCPDAMKHQILHSSLVKDSLVIMASDMSSSEGIKKGNNIALSVNCSSESEIRTYFSNLSQGGTVIHDLKTEFWGAIFGVLTDKYGIRWMFNYNNAQNN